MIPTSAKTVQEVARRSGLTYMEAKNRLLDGWTYIEDMTGSRWEAP